MSLPRVIDEAVIVDVARRLHEAAPSARIVLFGSHATGGVNRHSDLDLLVIEPEVEDCVEESVRLRRAVDDVLVPMDIIVVSELEVEEWRDVRGSLIHAALSSGKALVG